MALAEEAGGISICRHGLGAAADWPSLWEHLSGPHPSAYGYLIPFAVLGFLATAAAALPTIVRLSLAGTKAQEPPAHIRARRRLILVPPAAALVMAALKMMMVLAPRSWKIFSIPAAMMEAVAFWCFLQLMLNFIGGPSRDISSALEQCSPVKIWGRCLATPRVPGMRDVRIAKYLVGQFVLVVILKACIELDDVFVEKHRKGIDLFSTVSLVLCVIAELSLIRAAHELLEGRRAHAKFWTMKVLFIANMISLRIPRLLVKTDVCIGDMCYTADTLRAAYSGTITALVAALVAVLASFAFVPKDLLDSPAASSSSAESSFSSEDSQSNGPSSLEEGVKPEEEVDVSVN